MGTLRITSFIFLLIHLNQAFDLPICVPITAEYCQSVLPYKITRFPNLVGDDNQKEAINSITSYAMLVDTGCSDQLKFFLCSSYFPMCTDKVPLPIGPCRSICTEVHRKCLPVLRDFNLDWPMVLNCSKYPLENGFMNQVCMGDTNSSENESEPVDDSSVVVIEKTTKSKSSQSKTHPIKKCDSSTQVYINKTNRCASQCYAFDSVDQQEMEEHARYTLAILGLIAVCFFICCLLISLVKRCHGLDFTDYCLLFGGASFAMSTFLQIVNIQFRDLISCTQYNSISIVVVPELHHIPCVLVAIMTYYLGTTGRLWCVMACFGWRKSLMNSPKHDTNNFRFKSSTIACTASFPIILLALMSRSTNIDIFTGLCSITQGSSSLQNLFTTLREFAFLILSIFPLFCGCLRQLSPFNNSYNRNTNPKPLFKNLLTILFTLIYFLFTTFWFYYSVQLFFATSVNVTKETTINQWDLITAIKTYADPILAILTCAIFLISIILKCYFQTHQSLAPIQKMNDGMTVYLPTTLPPAPPPNYVIGINQVDEYDSTMLSNSNKIGR